MILLEAGQPVVWTYRSQGAPCHIHVIEAKVVQAGQSRVRIQLRDSEGHSLLRRVTAGRLGPKQVNEIKLPPPVKRMSD